jgi:hypothetical protein
MFVRTAGPTADGHTSRRRQQRRQQHRGKAPGLALRLFRLSRSAFIAQGLWQLLATVLEFTSPLAMQQIVNFISNYDGGRVTARVT